MSKLAVAMSGGVDSSVAALLLKEAGHEVAGITMRLGVVPASTTEEQQAKCGGHQETEDAQKVCMTLGIPHHVVDFSAEMEELVIRPFVEEYLQGRTPNPCVTCNRTIKFGALLQKALDMGFDGLATGHYAAIEAKDGRCCLRIPKDRRKDQTYFLHAIPREALAHVRFPLAGYTKDEVRELAARAGLPVFGKPESQDICFMPEGGREAFLSRRGIGIEPGDITDRQGRIVGRHRGIACYTIGQRGGLGISAPEPLYVLAIDSAHNRLVVGGKADLRAEDLVADQVNLLVDSFPVEARAKIRYAHRAAPCRVSEQDGRLTIRFAEPQEAVTPGQSVVLYDGETLLGGGIIQEVF
jgi:tRNA-specific 2-thiouridylase